jgi:hypothetical protein
MEWYVKRDSVVRKIWGKPDTILFIFAGAAAEFALNKAVDWLFFTGKLPADPLGRLFSTVAYARQIIFSETEGANKVIDRMASIHHQVEASRGYAIPQWAYRDVLYMLIDYTIRSHELLSGKLTAPEKAEVYDVFRRVGVRMNISELPQNFTLWKEDRDVQLFNDLEYSRYSKDLYRQYRKNLGLIRFKILRSAQGIIVPPPVSRMLQLRNSSITHSVLIFYRVIARLKLDWILKSLILPSKYIVKVRELEAV